MISGVLGKSPTESLTGFSITPSSVARIFLSLLRSGTLFFRFLHF